jgi:hypothetical protein
MSLPIEVITKYIIPHLDRKTVQRVLRIKYFFELLADDQLFWKYMISHGEFADAVSTGIVKSIRSHESPRDYYFAHRYIKVTLIDEDSIWSFTKEPEPDALDIKYVRDNILKAYSDEPLPLGILVNKTEDDIGETIVLAKTMREGISKLIDDGVIDITDGINKKVDREIDELADLYEIWTRWDDLDNPRHGYIDKIKALNGNKEALKKYLLKEEHVIIRVKSAVIFISYPRIILEL